MPPMALLLRPGDFSSNSDTEFCLFICFFFVDYKLIDFVILKDAFDCDVSKINLDMQ